ncbi:MAG: PAS domain-containing protein [Gemmatimonadota bacterium]|nr:PAS domain-containing protein [Gemmatimonadota bacterium]
MDFKKALENVSDGVVALDSEWRVSYVNSRAELLYRKKRSELCENVWWDIFPYLAGSAAEEELRQAARGTMMRRIKVFHPPLYTWHDKLAIPSEGGLLLVIRDVTDIMRMQQTEAVRSAVREVFDQAPIAITLLRGPEHRIDIMNPMSQRLLGGRNLEGVTVRNALPELEGQGLFELLDQVYGTGRPYEGREIPIQYDRNGDGTMYEGLFNITYQPLVDTSGNVYGVLSLSVEVADSDGAR